MKVIFVILYSAFFLVGTAFSQSVTKYMIDDNKEHRFSIGLRLGNASSTAETSSNGFAFRELQQINIGLDLGLIRRNGSAFKAKFGFATEQNKIGAISRFTNPFGEGSEISEYLSSNEGDDVFFQSRLSYLFKPIVSFKRLKLQPLVGIEVLSGLNNRTEGSERIRFNVSFGSDNSTMSQIYTVTQAQNNIYANNHNLFTFFGIEVNLTARRLPLYVNYTLGYRQPLFSSPFIQYEIIRSVNDNKPTRYSGEVRGTAVMNSLSVGFIF